jgi:hypothetical protein
MEAFLGDSSEVLAPAAFHICQEFMADSGIGSRGRTLVKFCAQLELGDRRFVRAEIKVNYLVRLQICDSPKKSFEERSFVKHFYGQQFFLSR